jgi:serine/threonine-protein kinase
MPRRASDLDAALPLDVLERIDLICDHFEEAWKQGNRPRLEGYLEEMAEEHRPALLRHLLVAEIECRRCLGETPVEADYRDRFPEQVHLLAPLLARACLEAPTLPAPSDNTATPAPAPTEPVDPVPRPPLPRRYDLKRLLGQGGMGDVWLGRDRHLHRPVAVKVVQQRWARNPNVLGRFVEEAQLTSQLQHPGIPPVYERSALPDGRPYFCMKVVRGRTLAALLEQRTGPDGDVPRLLGIFEQVCQAVAYAHNKGVIHRDLKPANVMVGAFGEVQVMDWGLAKVLRPEVPEAEPVAAAASVVETDRTGQVNSLTQAGTVLGTYAYMAPEQAGGEVGQLDRRCDVFGLGAILCEILTGKPPYVAATVEGLKFQSLCGDLADAHARLDASGADNELLRLTRACLAVKPNDRPRDAGKVAEAIAAYLVSVQERLHQAEIERAAAEVRAEEEAKTRALAEDKATAEWIARWLTALFGLVLFVLFGIVAGGWLWLRGRETTQAVTTAIGEAERMKVAGKWPEALAAAELAETLLAEGGASSLRQPVRQTCADLRMVTHLEAIHQETSFCTEDPRDLARAAREYAVAFERYGIDVVRLPTADAAELVRQSAIRRELEAALHIWAGAGVVLKQFASEGTTGRPVLELSLEITRNSWPSRLLSAVAERNRGALQTLAREADVEAWPVFELGFLAQGLCFTGDKQGAVVLLRRALHRRPDAFLLNDQLSFVLRNLEPPQWEEALRHAAVAAALRPTNARAQFNVGMALQALNRPEEALVVVGRAAALPRAGCVYSFRGLLLKEMKAWDDSLQAFREALHLKEMEAWDDSLQAFREALRVKQQAIAAPGAVAARGASDWDLEERALHREIGYLCLRKGEFAAAVDHLRRGGAPAHEVQACEDLAAADGVLEVIRRGEAKPRDTAQQIKLAEICYVYRRLYAAAARFYAGAFTADPALANDLRSRNRLYAARAAAQAAAGRGQDAGQLDEKERILWRERALRWLREDLLLWARELDQNAAAAGDRVRDEMRLWQSDAALAGLRGDALAKLGAEERNACQSLWADVEKLLHQAGDKK